MLIASSLLLATIAMYLPASLAFNLNSDQLTVPSLFWDITQHGWHQLAGWQLSRAPYVFPDIPLFFAVGGVVPGTLNQIFVACLIIFLLWIMIAGWTVARATGRPMVQCAAVMLLLEAALTWLLAGSPFETLAMYRYGMANHFTALVAAWALFNVIYPAMTDAGRNHGARRLAACLLIPLLSLSDQSFVVYYILPIGAVILDCGVNRTVPIRRMLLLGLEQALPALLVVVFGRRLLEAFVALQAVPTFDASLIPIAFIHMMAVIPHDQPVIIVGFWIPLVWSLIYGLSMIVSARAKEATSETAVRRRLTAIFCLCSTMATLLVTSEVYQHLGHMLYLTPALENPLILAAIVLTPLVPARWLRWLLPAFTAVVAAVYLSIVIPAHDIRQPLVARSAATRLALAACVRDHRLTAGLAPYAIARNMMAMLDWQVPVAQLWPDYPALFYWGSNLDWYSQAIDGRPGFPRYNFIVLDGFKDSDVIGAFGHWDQQFECDGMRIAKYDRPDALSSRVDEWLAQIDGRLKPRPGQAEAVPLPVFRSLVGHRTDQGWQADAGVTPAGYLMFGPYWPVDPGRYKVIVTVWAESLDDQSRIEVVSDTGTVAIASAAIPSDGRRDLTLEGTVVHAVHDLEVRTYYGGKGTLRIEKVVLQREQTPTG